jgi:hypothetical protein
VNYIFAWGAIKFRVDFQGNYEVSGFGLNRKEED